MAQAAADKESHRGTSHEVERLQSHLKRTNDELNDAREALQYAEEECRRYVVVTPTPSPPPCPLSSCNLNLLV